MININQNKVEYLRKLIPDVRIVRTVKHKSGRHKYYVEEIPEVLNALKEYKD